MIRNRNVLTMSSFTAMFFLGVGSAIIGAASRNIGLSPYQIGLLLATQNIGFILSVITVGTLADSTDKARLMFAASLIILNLKYRNFHFGDTDEHGLPGY